MDDGDAITKGYTYSLFLLIMFLDQQSKRDENQWCYQSYCLYFSSLSPHQHIQS